MRDLRFGGVALGELACALGYGVVVFGFLKEHPEPELLAWAIVVSYGARTVVWWIAQRGWHPSFIFRMKYVREVSSFSLSLLGASVGTYLLQRLDYLLISHIAGEGALGIYGAAKRLILRPTRMLGQLVTGVLVPALARIQDDFQGMRRLYSRGLGGAVIAVFPCVVGIALVMPLLMVLNSKPEWAGVRWVVVALLPYALLFTVMSSVGPIFVSLKRTDLMLRVNLGTSAACLAVQAVLALVFRDRGGAEIGTILAAGSSVTMLLLAPWALRTALNLIGMSLGDALRPLVSTMLATLGMAGAVLGVHALLGPGVDPKLALTADVIIGALSYGALVWWLRPPALADLLGFVGMKKRA
jgi:PST family polysaccharide transporter